MASTLAPLRITKIEAARRQLEGAVLLYFNEKDLLPIHTLAAAAQAVLEVLVKRAGKTTPLHDSLFSLLSPDLEKHVRQAIRGTQNFLKHADRDPDATLDFTPDSTEFLLYDAVVAYFRLTGDHVPILAAYMLWFAANRADSYTNIAPEAHAILRQGKQAIAAGRRSFLDSYLRHTGRLRP